MNQFLGGLQAAGPGVKIIYSFPVPKTPQTEKFYRVRDGRDIKKPFKEVKGKKVR
jgi:hypothetical protein